MAEYLTNTTDLTKVASAIREKGGTSGALVYPDGFVSAINAIATGSGSDDVLHKLLTRTISGEYSSDREISIGKYAFAECIYLTGVSFPQAEIISESAFYNCSRITHIDFPKAKRIELSGLRGLAALTRFALPNMETLATYSFFSDNALTTADFHKLLEIGSYAFTRCSALVTLIIRSSAVARLVNENAFNSTPIKNGTGYIYVPSDLVDGYKTATNWATYANQIRAIEDYPSITGG